MIVDICVVLFLLIFRCTMAVIPPQNSQNYQTSNMQQRRQICGYCDSQPLPHSPDYHYPRSSTHVLTIFHSNLDEFMHNGANWRLLDCLVVEFPGGARSEIVGIRWNTHRRAKIFLQRSRISSARKQSARKQFLKER